MKRYRLVILMLSVISLLSGAAARGEEAPDGGGATVRQELAPEQTISYDLFQVAVRVLDDGSGEMVLTMRVRNVDRANYVADTFTFNWANGVYTNARAWDSAGPLSITTQLSGSTFYITTDFRQEVQPGESYLYNIALTIGGMATELSPGNWEAAWYWNPGWSTDTFIETVTLPSNATITSVSPQPDIQTGTQLQWQMSNWPGGAFYVDIFYTTSNQNDVPLFLQSNQELSDPPAPWASDAYGAPSGGQSPEVEGTIGTWGSYTTSAAMLLAYWANAQEAPVDVDPGVLNRWLRDRGGYDSAGFPVEGKILSFALAHELDIGSRGFLLGEDDPLLQSYLRSGNPVLLDVGGHFVVATGVNEEGAETTYDINDPLFGKTTLLAQWSNSYEGMLLITNGETDDRALRIATGSPVEMVLTDPAGNKQGYDPITDTLYDQIAGGEYYVQTIAPADNLGGPGLEEQSLLVDQPVDGEYGLDIIGLENTSYQVDAHATGWNGMTIDRSNTGTVEANERIQWGYEYVLISGFPLDLRAYLPVLRMP